MRVLVLGGDGFCGWPTTLYLSDRGHDITIIDMATQKVISTLKVGALVHGICAQGDGRKAFVTIESNHTLRVLDTKTNTITDTIELPGRPNECAATIDGRYVVVPLLEPANSAVIIDMTQKKIVKTLPLRHPHNCFTPEGGSSSIVYCEERDAFRIHRIDLAKMEVTNVVKVAGDPRPFAITKDEKTTVKGNSTHETTGNTKQKAQTFVVEAGSSMTVKGVSVNVEASAALTLKGATINIQGSGPVSIKGTPISIG